MLIGLTYDLKAEYLSQGFTADEVAEFDSEETISGIEQALQELGHQTIRIGHLRNLVKLLDSGEKWDLVFNICEGMYGLGREAQVPAVLDAWNIPYTFSDPLVLALTLHKGLTKRVIRDAKIPTADFFIINDETEISKCHLSFPVFIKPVAEGSGKGIGKNSLTNDFETFKNECIHLLQTYNQPVLAESYLPGREFTAGITGSGSDARIAGIMEVLIHADAEETAYSRFIKENYEGRVEYQLLSGPDYEACAKVALDAWNVLGCRDAGRIDLKMDEQGVPCFIEVNPLAGLNYLHSDLPIIMYLQRKTYTELIAEILNSAVKRSGLKGIKV
jgi:D-alanine-D-alanine ligase